jgi:3-oxoacyl-[acyl-carrier protein] reductase
MLERGYGRILHIASIAGKEGNAGMAAYSSTKAGLIGLVKTMGKEYATTGITINAMAPAVIQTPMVDVMPQEQVEYMTERSRCGEPAHFRKFPNSQRLHCHPCAVSPLDSPSI